MKITDVEVVVVRQDEVKMMMEIVRVLFIAGLSCICVYMLLRGMMCVDKGHGMGQITQYKPVQGRGERDSRIIIWKKRYFVRFKVDNLTTKSLFF